MAKARSRPPFAAAERFLGLPRGAVAPAPAGFDGGDDDLPDLAEADVWYAGEQGPSPRRQPGPAAAEPAERRAPRRGVRGGLSRAFGDGPGGRQLAASAPVEVPAWPPSAAPAALPFEMDPEEDDGLRDGGWAAGWVPPHVYLARRQARASVVEGAGRTLKGRDMSRVRDAVWSRTGFDG